MPAPGIVHVGRHFFHIFYDAILHPALKLEIIALAVPLVAHLGNHTVASGSFHHQMGFLIGPGKRLFHVNVLTKRHGQHGDGKVRKVGSPDANGIDLSCHPVKHLPEILEPGHIRVGLQVFKCMGCPHIRVTEGHCINHPGVHEGPEDTASPVSYPTKGHVHFVGGRNSSQTEAFR